MRSSVLLAFVLILSGLAVPVQAAPTCPAGTSPAIENPATFNDGCYHQYLLYDVDTPQVDVLILPPATANNAVRDITLIEQSIAAWSDGIEELGEPWFRAGFDLDWYRVGIDPVPQQALWDPELVVVSASYNPVRVGVLGIGQNVPVTACHGIGFPITSEEEARGIPNLHWHPGSIWASARAECANGGFTCFVINMEQIGNTDGQRRNMYDLVSHEFGHCLGIGHVGDALDFTAAAVPSKDIMSYAVGSHVHCVSSMDLRALEYTYAHLLGQAPNRNTAGKYMRSHPADWNAVDCAEPTVVFTDTTPLDEADPLGEPKEDDDGGSTEDEGEPMLSIAEPSDGTVVDPGQTFTIAGTVDRDGRSSTSTSSTSGTSTTTSSTSTSTGPGPTCGGATLLASDATDDSTGPGAVEAHCIGAAYDGSRFAFTAAVADKTDRTGIAGALYYDIYFQPEYGALAGTTQLISVESLADGSVSSFWDVGGNDPTGILFPQYVADPTRADVQASWTGDAIAVSFPISYLGSPQAGDRISGIQLDTNYCTGTTCSLQHPDFVPDAGGATATFASGSTLAQGSFGTSARPALQPLQRTSSATASSQCSGTLPTPTFLQEAPRCLLDVPDGATRVVLHYNTTYTGLFSAIVELFDGSGASKAYSLDDCPTPDPGVQAVFACVLESTDVTAGTWWADIYYQAGEATEDYTLTMLSYGATQPTAERVVLHDGETLIASSADLDTSASTLPASWSTEASLLDEGTHTLTATWMDADGSVLDTAQLTIEVATADPCAGVTSGPAISSIAWTAGDDSATITWTTDVAASSLVNYGTSPSHGSSDGSATPTTSHSRTLTGLSPDTTYHYEVTSARCGYATQSVDNTFTTTGRAPGTQVTSPTASSITEAPITFEGTFDLGSQGGTNSGSGLVTAASGSTAWANTLSGVMSSQAWQELVDRVDGLRGFAGAVPDLDGGATVFLTGKVPRNAPARVSGFDIDYEPKTKATLLRAPATAPTEAQRLTVAEAVDDWEARMSEPAGPALPGLPQGIGPGSALLQGVNGVQSLCTLSYIFQDPRDPTQYYASTAGHCLLASGAGIDRTGEANPSQVNNHFEVCYADCIDNALAIGTYVVIERSATFEPVAYASAAPVGAADAEGIGRDFGLLRIPKALNGMLRPSLAQWGGADGLDSALIGDVVLHYGHGTYCCPQVGGLASRTPVDQGRAGVAVGSYADGSYQIAGWITGGDSGSPSAIGFTDADKVLRGTLALGVNTHGLITGAGVFDGTLLSKGQAMVASRLGFTPNLVLANDDIATGSTGTQPAVDFTSPAAGAVLDAASVSVSGTATFPDGAGSGTQAPITYYLHRPGCGDAADVLAMDQVPAAAAEAGHGCGNLAGTRMSQAWPATQDPGTTIPAGSTVVAHVRAFGLRPHPNVILTGTLTANGASVGGGDSAPTHVIAVALASTPCTEFTVTFTTTAAIAADADLTFAASTQQGTQDLPVCYEGGTGASRVTITPLALPEEQVQVSVDDSAFGAASLLAVTGSASWSATWDLAGVAPGTHTLHARMLQDGVPVGPIATRTVTVDQGVTEAGARTQLRLAGPGGLMFDWTTVQVHGEERTGTWSHAWGGPAAAGEYTVFTRLMDDDEVLATTEVAFVIDTAPELTTPATATATEGEAFDLQLTANDPDSEVLSFDVAGLPSGATLDGSMLRWTPGYTDAGTYTLEVTVSDGYLADQAFLTLDVSNVNRAPVLADVADQTVAARDTLTFTVSASDPDGDAVTLAGHDLPEGAAFDAASGTFSWTPTNKQASKEGTPYTVHFTASDGTLGDSVPVTITVTRR